MNDDLISRKALLKAMEEERQYLINRGQTGAEHILVHHCLPLIDNAPTVDMNTKLSVAYLNGRRQGQSEGRPHGEWIDQDEGAQYPMECSVCHKEPIYAEGIEDGYVLSRYCPNCGAEMKGCAE